MKFKKPKSFDFNLIVIGAGSAGLTVAYMASQLKAKTALVEKNKMGGDCLNTGCVPSKALIRSAKILSLRNKARELGFNSIDIDYNFEKIKERVQRKIQKIAPHDSVERYEKLGVHCFKEKAELISPYEVKIGGLVYKTRAIVIATGAGPKVIPFKGLDKINYYTSDSLWDLKTLPKRWLVLGGGPIGCELAQAFQSLGSQAIIVDLAPRLLARLDDKVSKTLSQQFERDGIKTYLSSQVKEFQVNSQGEKSVLIQSDSDQTEQRIVFDELLLALGRQARTEGFGLEKLGIKISKQSRIESDEFMATNYPNIFVCGDATSPYQFTHIASYQAYFACLNALFRPYTYLMPPWIKNKFLKAHYHIVPWALYTSPELAQAGFSRQELQSKGIPFQSVFYDLKELDRAITDGEDKGYIEVLTPPGKDKILGVTIVHARASEMISEFVLAMTHNLGLKAILGAIHIYPTFSEGNKYAAGRWMQKNKSERALKFLEKFHTWRRS